MFGKNFQKQKAGKAISARRINQSLPDVDRLSKLRAGSALGSFSTSFGAAIYANQATFEFAITQSGGIPARDSNNIYSGPAYAVSLEDNGDGSQKINSFTDTYDVYNLSSQAVAGNTYIIAMFINSIWICIWEDCPTP